MLRLLSFYAKGEKELDSMDTKCVNAIRVLAADAVQKANSGHPGLPLGCAPMAYELWAHHMKHNAKNPQWANRDRFILSGGHGSSMLYALLHLFGYGLTMDDLKSFRQDGSLMPGHSAYGHRLNTKNAARHVVSRTFVWCHNVILRCILSGMFALPGTVR